MEKHNTNDDETPFFLKPVRINLDSLTISTEWLRARLKISFEKKDANIISKNEMKPKKNKNVSENVIYNFSTNDEERKTKKNMLIDKIIRRAFRTKFLRYNEDLPYYLPILYRERISLFACV